VASVVGLLDFQSLPVQSCLNQHHYRPFVHKTFTELSRAGGKASISSMKTRLLEVVKLLTTKEATTILGCHLETLYQWVKQGKIGCIRTGRNLKFHPQHIQEYFERQSRSV
jgi:excisionase family DNA binding protein